MSRISRRLANRRAEPLQKLIVFRIRQEWFAVLIEFAQKVIPLGLVYGAPQGGISLTRYQDREIPIIDIEHRVFKNSGDWSATPALVGSDDASVEIIPQTLLEDQRYLIIVQDIQGLLVGVPVNSSPMLRRVPKSAFSPIPEVYLSEGNIKCVSAVITESESEPPFFLLNLDQLLPQAALPAGAPEDASRSLQQIAGASCLQSDCPDVIQ